MIPEQAPVPSAAKPLVEVERDAVVAPLRRAWRTLETSQPIAIYRLRRFGLSGGAGVVLLLGAFVLATQFALPAHHAVARLQALPMPQPVVMQAAVDVADSAVEALPARGEVPQIVEGIYRAAADSGVTLTKGEYELAAESTARIARYRVAFPVSATYPQVRRFIDQTLTRFPSVGVDGLRMDRRNVGEAAVVVELRLSIFSRNSS